MRRDIIPPFQVSALCRCGDVEVWMMAATDDLDFWVELLSVKGISSSKWLRLSRTIPVRRMVSMVRSSPGREELGRLLGKKIPPPDHDLIERQLQFAERENCGVITISDKGYPYLLREIGQPPPVIFYSGDAKRLQLPSFCVVGSRSASRRGMAFARKIAFELGLRGFIVISGMARGIDSMVHEGALESGGSTCGVIGCGIDIAYPPENLSLSMDIISNGLLLSEFLPGTPPLRHNFPQRNRIMSGLSIGVLVVEAGVKSGAMNTARWAADQGREVFAVPGPVDEEWSRGPHMLIREGACLVESVDDILFSLPPCGRLRPHEKIIGGAATDAGKKDRMHLMTEDEKTVYSCLELNPKHVDELIRICHISATSILPVLLDLEMKGLVENCGGRYALPIKREI
ncbi:MAG: DNA-processing protein DprA [Candidatus Krumholzibacteriota bacterium]|nr:DNA-processing protein DprA [Candidatus Krumholzibacteriota bacterium]